MPTVTIPSQLKRLHDRVIMIERLNDAQLALERARKLYPNSEGTLSYYERRVRERAKQVSELNQLEIAL